MFLALFVFLAWISLLLCLKPCSVLRSTFLYAYMSRCTHLGFFAMLSYVLFFFLLYVDVRVIFSHACMALLAMPCLNLVFTCSFPCYMFRYLSSHAYMLASKFFHVYASARLQARSYAHMFRSMFSHARVFGSTFFTCFMLSSMCLCALCHVCVPSPRLCLSCHVLL